MTQRQAALAGQITPAMRRVAEKEGLDPEFIRAGVAAGTICNPSQSGPRQARPRRLRAGTQDQGQRQHRDLGGLSRHGEGD